MKTNNPIWSEEKWKFFIYSLCEPSRLGVMFVPKTKVCLYLKHGFQVAPIGGWIQSSNPKPFNPKGWLHLSPIVCLEVGSVGLLHRILFPQLLFLKLGEGYFQNKGCSDIQMNIRCPPKCHRKFLGVL